MSAPKRLTAEELAAIWQKALKACGDQCHLEADVYALLNHIAALEAEREASRLQTDSVTLYWPHGGSGERPTYASESDVFDLRQQKTEQTDSEGEARRNP